jgi:Ca2+/Na+ antiporter
MESKEFKSGFSEVDYKWDLRIRRSFFPSFIIFFMSIFLTDKSLKYGIEQVPMLTVCVYYVYFFVYTAYVYPQRKKYNQQLIDQIKIPYFLKLIPIVLISVWVITVVFWSFL